MTELAFVKTPSGLVIPAEAGTTDFVEGLKVGDVIRCEFRKARNYRFHRKYFALLDLAYEYYEPRSVHTRDGVITPEKNREEFRKWCVIKAGFYQVIGYPDGSVRARAKSMKFSQMDEQTFAALYSKTIDVLLRQVFGNGWSREAVEDTVNQILNFC
ncbi:DUF1367 family protein [Candidatus Sororendozoicomonas aggregata]|uniref:DUF1367 family protein n=1 Tax=Candidatus Sororendozoicomonas aggregata TaxID=3073239 RepID=UPI002ED6A3E4